MVTVGELIEVLKELDPSMKVETKNRDDGGDYYGSSELNEENESLNKWIDSCKRDDKLILE